MRTMNLAILAALSLAGCQGPPPEGSPPQSGGSTFLAVVATPFVWAFKVPTCAATAVMLTPVVVGAAAANTAGSETQRDLGVVLDDACTKYWIPHP